MSERAEKLGLFNPDILELVLSKLQTRDLLRMKCVSRSWRDLIRNRSFALRHSRQRPPPLSGFLFQKNLGWTGLDVSDVSYILAERKEEELPRLLNNIVDSIPADLMMVSSCNGLICGTRCSFQNDTLAIRVGNPLTREGFHFDWKRCGGRVIAVGLAFDPCHDLTNNSTNFKVVLVQEEAGSDGNVWLAFHVYSSETGTWRLSDVNDGFLLLNVSGAIYLLNTRDGGFRRIADVAAFGTKDEPLSGVVLPYSMSLVPLNRP
ncbi:unnamed protein product [Linum tenue]|uniref:F-box domain-containing protein n=1 Tax=Linum tenue TaxID=586396 RepID=A0AAV0JG03_9ROSI|nr:unnamed protein product [Linum tenue]